jgi:hypothetical protein
MVITDATRNCTLEVSPLLKINNTTSTVQKLFVYSETIYYNFFASMEQHESYGMETK